MELKEILSKCDHTLLSPTATWEEIRLTCEDAVRYGAASACIPPSFVKQAKDAFGNGLTVCTVIGFPNGYAATPVKCFEARQAVADGADEIDMVVNLGWVKDKLDDRILDEINAVKDACGGKLLKVIVETCVLTREEKIRMCRIVSESRADFIKTSTGFSAGGATREDIALFKAHVSGGTRIKAAGGIKTPEDAEAFLTLGADRLGTSRIIRLVKELQA